jgi:ATP-binding cassette subfamily B protein
MQGRTVIAIAHRMSTVRQFDRVLVIEAGRLVQDGKPDDLAVCAGAYRDLLRAQEGRRLSTHTRSAA